jgi:hypothetical protein
MSLAELFVEDDLDVAVDPETYQDQTNPAPPLPGNYRLVALGPLVTKKDKAGQPVVADGKFPVFTLQRVKIVEPVEAEKEFGLFHDLRSKPFDRFGTVATDIGDIVRAMDQTRGWSGLREGVSALEELLEQNTSFVVKLTWEAYDGAFVEQEFDELGISKGSEKKALADGRISKDAYNGIYKKARLGARDFKPNGKGGLIHIAKGPSGAMLEARPKIQKFIPSLEQTNLGAFRVK